MLIVVRPLLHHASQLRLPFFGNRIQAGFPSPADDYVERYLDLNEFLIAHPAATFFVQVSGDSMIEAGILEGDYLVVDRALEPNNGKVVVAALDGELTVKRFYRVGDRLELRPDNQSYPPISISGDMNLQIWGVVTSVIRKMV